MRIKLGFSAVVLSFFLLTLGIFSWAEERGDSTRNLAEEGDREYSPNLFASVREQTPVQPEIPAQKISGSNKISLDIKGMDIVDVLKMLSSRAGMNIVIGKNVTGRATLFLKDVDIWDAFEIILLSNDLAYEKKGDIINVMAQRDYELLYGERYEDKKEIKIIQLKYAKASDLSRALAQIKTNIGRVVVDEVSNTLALIDIPAKLEEMESFIRKTDLPLETKVFNLNYAQAEKIQAKIQEAVTKGIGTIKTDERTNKIIVTDYPDKLEEISKIITAFDERTPQVLIDAQIIQINPSDLFEMGVNWDAWIKKYFDMKASLPIGTNNRLFFGTPDNNPKKKEEYKAIVDVLRTIGDLKVLSSPRIMSLNNQEAKIHVGTRDAYITSTTSQSGTGTTVTSQSVNFVDTGIQLYVTPTINRDGFVTMKIKPEISDATRTEITSEGQITQVPIVSTSEAETTVTVKDGVTIIIGGLAKDKKEKTVRKIPILGDIPLLGVCFRSTSDNLTKTELVILLTPHILSGEDSYISFNEIPPENGARVKMVKGEIVTERIVKDFSKVSLNDLAREYSQLVVNKVKAIFYSKDLPAGEKGNVDLLVIISKDGDIIDQPRIVATSNPLLDAFAIDTVQSAAPFPAFPEYLNKEKEAFKISLSYK